ncbi:hypothetical protein AJ80_05931 [Polytolypa hystricis UAMH7299]|uniref:FAD-binding PCMH-type domain-containing protein n=1 Tax=Polytolypa hystricis (strain UAMH7299) TaxID=1447883 RepID=A0A2B7XZY9_POLH7|nr:hypothetical protein AJ80_05931 [Polytolypa hystricis UAMH7299]
MKAFLRLFTCGIALIQTLVAGTVLLHDLQDAPITRRDLSVPKVRRELGRFLSHSSTIFGPRDPGWDEAIGRYNGFAMPDIEIVVRPGEERDIPKIVKYCNRNGIDFMVVNRGHALTSTIGSFKGVQIDMGSLNGITIQPDGKSAWLQGGTYGGPVIETLWDEGYVATTGSCGCVGLLGPGLGGGHGRLEGLYGLVSDNFINLNVVLADGSTVRVNETSHEDLWWAMQGAGHNFGIVTSFELKIHPRLVDSWHYHNYVWTEDKLETVFEELNKFHNNGSTPELMAAILAWSFVYSGPEADAEELLQPFNEIGAVSETSGDVPYPQIASMQGTSVDDIVCAPGGAYATSTVGLQVYNITTQRQLYISFNEKIAQYPELKGGAMALHEGYSNKRVQTVDSASSAFPLRDDFHLLQMSVQAEKGSYLMDVAQQWVEEARDIWNAGQPDRLPTTYVNYAAGGESLESIYGYEPWRLERLRTLKDKYDPNNRFRYYNPIV